MEAVKTALAAPGVELRGLHCHIGSQIFDVEPFELAAQVMADFMADIRDQTGVALAELNLGGGFGICYTSDNDPPAYDSYMERVSQAVKKTCQQRKMETPFILIEPGRSIVGPAGITLYRVGAVKEIPGVRTYVSVDGGMTDNPRYILYQSQYTFTVASRAADAKVQGVTVAGKCCESGDLLGENVPLQEVHPGDILAVLATGAYNYSMASNYNRSCRPPVVLVNGQAARVIIRRETYEDLIRNDEE